MLVQINPLFISIKKWYDGKPSKKGCCGRSFAKGKKDKKKRKKSGKGSKKPYRTRKYSIVSGLIQWKQMFTDIGVTREDILDNVRKNRIASKTYSTYAIDYKFRAKYVSLRIGTVPSVEPEPEKEVKKITKPIPKRKINTKFLTNFEINPNKKEVCMFTFLNFVNKGGILIIRRQYFGHF